MFFDNVEQQQRELRGGVEEIASLLGRASSLSAEVSAGGGSSVRARAWSSFGDVPAGAAAAQAAQAAQAAVASSDAHQEAEPERLGADTIALINKLTKKYDLDTKQQAELYLQCYFVFASIIEAVSLLPVSAIARIAAIPAVNKVLYYLLGVMWNMVDAIGAMVIGSVDWEKYKTQSGWSRDKFISTFEEFWGWILAGITVAATVVSLLVFTAIIPVAAAVFVAMAAASSLAFGVAMLIPAISASFEWFKESGKTTPLEILKRKIRKFNEFDDVTVKDSLKADIEALLYHCQQEGIDTSAVTAPDEVNSDVSNLTPDAEGKVKERAKNIIHKEKSKMRSHRKNALGFWLATAGAMLVFASIFCPPLLIAGAVIWLGAASVKAHQAYKTKREVKMRKAVFADHCKRSVGNNVADIETTLIQAYCEDENIPVPHESEVQEREKMVLAQCKKEAKKLSKQQVNRLLSQSSLSFFDCFRSRNPASRPRCASGMIG